MVWRSHQPLGTYLNYHTDSSPKSGGFCGDAQSVGYGYQSARH